MVDYDKNEPETKCFKHTKDGLVRIIKKPDSDFNDDVQDCKDCHIPKLCRKHSKVALDMFYDKNFQEQFPSPYFRIFDDGEEIVFKKEILKRILTKHCLDKQNVIELFRKFQNCIPQATSMLQAVKYTEGLNEFKRNVFGDETQSKEEQDKFREAIK